MNRSYLLLSSVALLFCCPMFAQDAKTVVSTDIVGVNFTVDGQTYNAPVTFTWPKGSKHEIRFPGNVGPNEQLNDLAGLDFTFSGWVDSTGLLAQGQNPDITITADPAITSYKATVAVKYKVTLLITEGPANGPLSPAICGAPGDFNTGPLRPGIVIFNGTCYWNNVTLYLPAQTLTLNAFPYPGFVFDGWTTNLGPTDAFLRTYELKGPVTLAPRFLAGRRVKFVTDPTGFKVTIDRADVPTPYRLPCEDFNLQPPLAPYQPHNGASALCIGEFDFGFNSKHTIGAPSPQLDPTGNYFVFDGFSNGAGQNTVYTALPGANVDTIIAKFAPGARVSIATLPVPLKLKVDGREDWPAYNFVWKIGGTYNVSAPAEAFDGTGRKYAFKGWSNGGPATQDVLVDSKLLVSGGFRLTATYDLLPRAIVQATQPGVTIRVDGKDCPAPCNIDRPAGATASVSAPASIPVSNLTRYDFTTWQDGVRTPDRTITFNTDLQNVNVSYIRSNKLTFVSDPMDGAILESIPSSPDGFYPSDQRITVKVTPKGGYKFRRWDGDLFSANPLETLAMNFPRTIRAMLDKVPFIAPAGVRNAAADTPSGAVAARSIVSIYGINLAPRFEVGPSSPLAQTIAGATVFVGDRLLPLIYVSPDQINAVLPSDLAPGDYSLTIRVDGVQDVGGNFKVVRNAPGLFINQLNNQSYVLAFHEDGSTITPDSPARRNEIVTVYGTGFGPLARQMPDGFVVPDTLVLSLADGADITAGSLKIQPTFTGAAPGYVGVDAIKFRVANLPAAAAIDFRITVNGADSNTLLLPLE
jgi:uncharacterized protein (TIGR03437 family)